MIAQDAINRVDRIKPNAFTDEDKLLWLDSLEGMIQAEIYLRCPEAIVRIESPEDGLSAPFPYDALYDLYLQAMIDFHNGEYDKYGTTYAMFNSKWEDFGVWYTTHYPTVGSLVFGQTTVSCGHDNNKPDDDKEEEEMVKTVFLKQDGYDDALNGVMPSAGELITYTAAGATFDEVVTEIKAGRPVAAYIAGIEEAFMIAPAAVAFLPGGIANWKDDLILIITNNTVLYWYQGEIYNIIPTSDIEK